MICTSRPSKPVGFGLDSAASYSRVQGPGRTAREFGDGLSWEFHQLSWKIYLENSNMKWYVINATNKEILVATYLFKTPVIRAFPLLKEPKLALQGIVGTPS
jgi:hypothetical protein